MDFRNTTPEETGAAHAVYLEVVAWLKAINLRQWLRALPEEAFQARQARGELFAGFRDDRIAAVVTLAFEEDSDWAECVGPDKHWWIKTLAVSRAFSAQRVGEQMMNASEAHVVRSGAKEIQLECVDGYLPGYYARLGYEVIKRKTITYPSGNTFPVALMRKVLA